MGIDESVLFFFASHRVEWLTSLMLFATNLGETVLVLVFSFIASAYFYAKKNAERALAVLVAVGGSALSVFILKNLVMRARPAVEAIYSEFGYSFPSGHATIAMAFYGFLSLALLKSGKLAYSALLAALVILIGVSRLYLGVHFLTDVLGGYLIGFAWILIAPLISKLTVSLLRGGAR